MHIISDKSLQRPGYVYNEHGIGYPASARPYIVWNHIDGPLLHCRDGRLHWLTLKERIRCWFGSDDAASLERKHWPEVVARST